MCLSNGDKYNLGKNKLQTYYVNYGYNRYL